MNYNKLKLSQLNAQIEQFKPFLKNRPPKEGWVRYIRNSLGMTLEQLATKLSVSKQSIRGMEQREKEGAVTLKTLREVGRAMDMELVYGFVPKDGSVEALVQRKARELAQKIVYRTSANMSLEDQQNSAERLNKAIEERTLSLMYELPRSLWD